MFSVRAISGGKVLGCACVQQLIRHTGVFLVPPWGHRGDRDLTA